MKELCKNFPKYRKQRIEAVRSVIKKLSKVQRNSFWVYDISDAIQRIQIWRHLMPRVELFYAAKTNPDLAIVK